MKRHRCKKPWKKQCIKCTDKTCPFGLSLPFWQAKWDRIKKEDLNEEAVYV